MGTPLPEHCGGAGTQKDGVACRWECRWVGRANNRPHKRIRLSALDCGPLKDRDSFAYRSLIGGYRNTFSGILDVPESIRRFYAAAGAHKDEVGR